MTSIESLTDDVDESRSDRRWRLFWALLLVAALPILIPYFIEMWAVQWYRYFPFVIIAVAALAYARSDGHFYPPRRWFHWATVGLGVLLIIASAVLQFTWFAAIAIFLIGTCCLSVMRGPRDSSLLVLAVPLAMLVRLPLRTDNMLVTELQGITTWLASVMLDVFGAPHAVAGNVIQLASKELFVAEACSGIQSVFTLAFLACLLVAVRRRRIWLVPIYLGISVFLAVAANVIRVTIVSLGEVWYEIDLTHGWSHELVGYFALGIAVLFLLSFDQLIVVVLHQVSEVSESNPLIKLWNSLAIRNQEGVDIKPSDSNRRAAIARQDDQAPLVRLATELSAHRLVNRGFIAAMVLVALFSVVQVLRSRMPTIYATDAKSVVFQPPEDLVGDSLSFLKVSEHQATRGFSNPRLGANSDIWICSADDIKAELVLSQPHTGWHELCVCYERQDWLLVNRDLTEPEIASVDAEAYQVPYVVARFKKPNMYGYLLFAGIGSDGTLVPSPTSIKAFTHRVWNRIDTTGVWEQTEVLMLQLWVVSPRKLEPETLKALEDDFVAIRSKIAASVSGSRQQNPNQNLTTGTDHAASAIAYQQSAQRDD